MSATSTDGDEQIGAAQVVDVGLDGVRCAFQLEARTKRTGIENGGDDAEQIIRHGADGLHGALAEALADVALKDAVYQGADILRRGRTFRKQLGKAALAEILIECPLAKTCGQCRLVCGVNPTEGAELSKGEREELHGMITPDHVGGQLTGEEFRVGAGHQDVHPLAKQSVDKEVPFRDVLHLIQEEHVKVAVQGIERLQSHVEVLPAQGGQAFVIEVHVPERTPRLEHGGLAEGRLPATANTDDHLGQGAVQMDLRLLHSADKPRAVTTKQFFPLICKHLLQVFPIHCLAPFALKYSKATKKLR